MLVVSRLVLSCSCQLGCVHRSVSLPVAIMTGEPAAFPIAFEQIPDSFERGLQGR